MNVYRDLQVNGYVMVPRALLLKVFEEHPVASGDMEAFLRVLTYVNYTDKVARYRKMNINCARGESVYSFSHWADILGWTVGRTRRFFMKFIAEGNLEKVEGDCISHIRIPGYDVWVGKKLNAGEGNSALKKSFEEFWIEYHDTTHMPRQNREDAFAAWRKLSSEDRKLALDNIREYYFHLRDTAYCRQAVKYLEKRLFRDEYD